MKGFCCAWALLGLAAAAGAQSGSDPAAPADPARARAAREGPRAQARARRGAGRREGEERSAGDRRRRRLRAEESPTAPSSSACARWSRRTRASSSATTSGRSTTPSSSAARARSSKGTALEDRRFQAHAGLRRRELGHPGRLPRLEVLERRAPARRQGEGAGRARGTARGRQPPVRRARAAVEPGSGARPRPAGSPASPGGGRSSTRSGSSTACRTAPAATATTPTTRTSRRASWSAPSSGRPASRPPPLGLAFGVAASVGRPERHGERAEPAVVPQPLAAVRLHLPQRRHRRGHRRSPTASRCRLAPQRWLYSGPWLMFAEWTESRQEVRRDVASAELTHRAWQVAGSWAITGENAHRARRRAAPPLRRGRRRGGVACCSRLRYGRARRRSATPSRSSPTRAARCDALTNAGREPRLDAQPGRQDRARLPEHELRRRRGRPAATGRPNRPCSTRFQVNF